MLQTAERILFRVNDDDTITAIVEIQYAGPPSQFGWVLPVSPGLTVDDLGTAPVGLFDALEERMNFSSLEMMVHPTVDGAACDVRARHKKRKTPPTTTRRRALDRCALTLRARRILPGSESLHHVEGLCDVVLGEAVDGEEACLRGCRGHGTAR